ncbi:MAG: homoserine dehydrogenase [Candidatus Binataceae bacterium]
MKAVRIALLGCGTVALELAGVADRSLKPDRSLGIGASLITRDAEALVTRPDIDIVVELFGGREPARDLILKALAAGKDVVTANKALLAEDGAEIFKAGAKAGRAIGFEASVGGGIPIIRTLREALAGDRQRAVYGIVNGTCNAILTMMSDHGSTFADALKTAQADGLAEADPTLDIDGHDAAHKLCLLVTLAFGVALRPSQVHTEGIRGITADDIAYARELGYSVKLLAIAKDDDGAIEARVHPTMIPARHLLASVAGAFNAIYIHGEALGSSMYFGRGAGEMPTATAVMADVIELARVRSAVGGSAWSPLGFPVSEIRRARVKPMDDVLCEYYLRFMARDKPGVLGAIASVLGRNGISIASVIQQGRGEEETTVPVIMRTHEARERNLKRALATITRLKLAGPPPAFIRIEEHL